MILFYRKKYKPLSISIIDDNSFILFGFLGQSILKFNNIKILKKNSNSFSFYYKNYKCFFKLFLIYYIGVSSGWFLKLEISGRGFFVYTLKNLGFFNLGFSHGISYIFLNNVENLVYEKKKRLKFVLHGINLFKLYNLAKSLKNLRPLNIYKGKGVKFENEFIKLKQGKKSTY